MTGTSEIILPAPSVVILPGNSIAGGVSTGEINFGYIVRINDLSENYEAGQNVAYLTRGQVLIQISNFQYAVIDEKNILYRETAAS